MTNMMNDKYESFTEMWASDKNDGLKGSDKFFGDIFKKSNKYHHFRHYRDDDNITIITKNLKTIKGEPVMIVSQNKAVYVKGWNVRPVRIWEEEIQFEAYAVRLQRKYFKTYTFRAGFDEFGFGEGEEDTFDSLVELAKEQDEVNLPVSKI